MVWFASEKEVLVNHEIASFSPVCDREKPRNDVL